MRRIEPWLIVDPQKPLPEREYLMTKAEARSFLGTPSCILCAACHSACPAVEVDADFPGPAALARLYRFAVDVRDDARKNRLEKIADTGLWWCVRCYLCVEACPKDVRPGEVITHLRELAAKETMVVEYGVKHAVAFRDNIRLYGNLNEFKLTKDTLGTLGLLKQLPRGVKMMLRGKTEAVKPFMKPIAHIEQVQEIYEEFGGKE